MSRFLCMALVAMAAIDTACAPLISGEPTTCSSESKCPDGFRCDEERGLCMAGEGAVDASAADTATPDIATSDTATADSAATDAAMPDTATTDAATTDAAMPDAAMPDAAMPDAAMPDAAMPDAAMPDAATTDAAALDQGSADACVEYVGQPCVASDLCGATYDCAGVCVGGEPDPGCPQCGTRSCVDSSYWGSCADGDCGADAYCDTDGLCQCTQSECEVTQCWGGDLYGCEVDYYGCGQLVLRQDCPANDCGGDPPRCGWISGCGWLECRNISDACVPGTSVLQCGSYGEACEACFTMGICQSASCIDGDCIYVPTSGDPCDDNRVCYLGQCCDSHVGEACQDLCPPCNCIGSGLTSCDGSCVLNNCFFVCQSC